ncbi:MAG TPA: GAF domain-containing protein [Gemmatimonadales bacterium]|nr:GAF domain-containing protein [Gemmatimonadales bacterium]
MAKGEIDFRQLIPLLHPRTRVHDVDVLKAWYEAVADALRSELVTDLFALWLYGPEGDPILIEPEALAQDNLGVPRAEPLANQLILDDVEDRIRRAGYGSVLLRPVRHGGQDVALLLLASFTPHAYGMRAEHLLESAISVMAPMLARVTRANGDDVPVVAAPPEADVVVPGVERVRDQAREGELFEGLSDAIGGAGTPRDLMLALSFALQPILPHDAYELLIPDSTGELLYRLGLHGHGSLWGDPALGIPRATLDPARLFGDRTGFILDDTSTAQDLVMPELVTVRGPEEPPRSLVGTVLRVVERPVGFLLLGSAGPGFYRAEDLALLDRVGALLSPKVESLVLAWQYSVLRGQFDVLRHVPMHLARVAELLATTPFLGEGSKLFVQQASAVLPVSALEFAVRLNDEARVAVVRPGSVTPLADLPQEPIEGTGVASVVRGEVPYLLSSQDESAEALTVLVVPLRAGGKIFGAMAMTAQGAERFTRTDMALAQQLADLAAPHLDLARRGGGHPPSFAPGWKRPSWRPERERGHKGEGGVEK